MLFYPVHLNNKKVSTQYNKNSVVYRLQIAYGDALNKGKLPIYLGLTRSSTEYKVMQAKTVFCLL